MTDEPAGPVRSAAVANVMGQGEQQLSPTSLYSSGGRRVILARCATSESTRRGTG
jgi:hypothetical protein